MQTCTRVRRSCYLAAARASWALKIAIPASLSVDSSVCSVAAIYHAELGSSAAILRAGYSIDTLMTRCADTVRNAVRSQEVLSKRLLTTVRALTDRYQGVDWRIKR